jgi:hypothetical protein
MKWKTWTKISALILFILAIAGFYLSNFYTAGALVEIQNFPSETQLDSIDNTQAIEFSFFLYNTGDRTSFVKTIYLQGYGSFTIEPKEDISIAPNENREIIVTLIAPNENVQEEITIQVFTDKEIITSQSIPIKWGGLLE